MGCDQQLRTLLVVEPWHASVCRKRTQRRQSRCVDSEEATLVGWPLRCAQLTPRSGSTSIPWLPELTAPSSHVWGLPRRPLGDRVSLSFGSPLPAHRPARASRRWVRRPRSLRRRRNPGRRASPSSPPGAGSAARRTSAPAGAPPGRSPAGDSSPDLLNVWADGCREAADKPILTFLSGCPAAVNRCCLPPSSE